MRRRLEASPIAGLATLVLLAQLVLVGCATESVNSLALSIVPTPSLQSRASPTPLAQSGATPVASRSGVASTQTATRPAPTGTPTSTATVTCTPTPSPTATLTAAPTATPSATPTPGPTPDGVARTVRVPILMYHYISEPPPGADIYRKDLSVAPDLFESHLQYLAQNGYQMITLDDLLYALTQGRPLPPKPVILTFDDGYEDNYQSAFRLLQKYGLVGHFFIITDFVNAGRVGYMTWPQIEEMAAAGQRFGSPSGVRDDGCGVDIGENHYGDLGRPAVILAISSSVNLLSAAGPGAYDCSSLLALGV